MHVILTHFKLMFHLYTPWKYLKIIGFSYIDRGYRNRILAWNGLTSVHKITIHQRAYLLSTFSKFSEKLTITPLRVRNVSFSENVTYVLNEWLQISILWNAKGHGVIIVFKISGHLSLSCYSLLKNCPYSELFWSDFPAFGLNTERYGVSLRIQSEWGKMWTRKTPNTHFSRSDSCYLLLVSHSFVSFYAKKADEGHVFITCLVGSVSWWRFQVLLGCN